MTYLPTIQLGEEGDLEIHLLEDEAMEEEEDPFMPSDKDLFQGEPESCSLLFPSTLGLNTCIKSNGQDVALKEARLREGQANDALEKLRQGIGEKSFMFRECLRQAKGVKQNTRARTRITAMDRSLTTNRCIYGLARNALIKLGAEVEGDTAKYKPVTRADMKASAIIYNINEPGQRNKRLAWFWSMHGQTSEAAENKLMLECEFPSGLP
jgi:hypothetical protein